MKQPLTIYFSLFFRETRKQKKNVEISSISFAAFGTIIKQLLLISCCKCCYCCCGCCWHCIQSSIKILCCACKGNSVVALMMQKRCRQWHQMVWRERNGRKRGEEMGGGKMKTATESAAKLPALESCPKAWNWTRVWQSVLQQGPETSPVLVSALCRTLWLIHQQMRQLPTGVTHTHSLTHTHTHINTHTHTVAKLQ